MLRGDRVQQDEENLGFPPVAARAGSRLAKSSNVALTPRQNRG